MNLILRREGGAPTSFPVSHFPFVIGKGNVNLPLSLPGIWEAHVTIDSRASTQLFITCRREATIRLNGAVCSESQLRLGDVLQIGSEKFRFELAQLPQQDLGIWEKMVVLSFGLLVLVEGWLCLGWLG